MTTLIKSHTGAMVPLRIGMHYRHDVIDRVFVVFALRDGFVMGAMKDDPDDCMRHDAKYCTMLHCPFQVGGVVCGGNLHFDSDDYTGIIVEIGDRIKVKCGDTYFISDEKFWRHASPDLRDAPDYRL